VHQGHRAYSINAIGAIAGSRAGHPLGQLEAGSHILPAFSVWDYAVIRKKQNNTIIELSKKVKWLK
jgi:hypothetical protein